MLGKRSRQITVMGRPFADLNPWLEDPHRGLVCPRLLEKFGNQAYDYTVAGLEGALSFSLQAGLVVTLASLD